MLFYRRISNAYNETENNKEEINMTEGNFI